jgi:ribosomal-protein-alanine N-acetyltransferase
MPHIETRCLRLRPITLDDLPALAHLWSDPDVTRYLPTGAPRDVEATRVELTYMVAHWQEHGFGTWVVALKDESDFIGYCGIQYLHEEPLRYGFETVQLPRIVAATHPDNFSRHILEKLGMRHDAQLRYYGDCPHFVITRREFRLDDSFYVLQPA